MPFAVNATAPHDGWRRVARGADASGLDSDDSPRGVATALELRATSGELTPDFLLRPRAEPDAPRSAWNRHALLLPLADDSDDSARGVASVLELCATTSREPTRDLPVNSRGVPRPRGKRHALLIHLADALRATVVADDIEAVRITHDTIGRLLKSPSSRIAPVTEQGEEGGDPGVGR